MGVCSIHVLIKCLFFCCFNFLILLSCNHRELVGNLFSKSKSSGLVEAIWTKFDIIRPFPAWGTNATTPFFRIPRPEYCNGFSTGPGTNAKFGFSVTNLGDVDGDHIDDVAVGAIGETVNYGGGDQVGAGGVYVLFMNLNGTIKGCRHINGVHDTAEPRLQKGDQFGFAVSTLDDIDGDGISELIVGAPGLFIPSVYILNLRGDASVKSFRLVRGRFDINLPANITQKNITSYLNESYVPNGPPIRYGSRFGSALCSLGDLNNDGVGDFAASAITVSGASVVYLLYLNASAFVYNYTVLTAEMAGFTAAYSSFGSSMVLLPRVSIRDKYRKMVIGVSRWYEAGSLAVNSGAAAVFYITNEGRVNHTVIISETSSTDIYGADVAHIGFKPGDVCASSMTTIGDINRDNLRQQRWDGISVKRKSSIPDIVLGCPQTQSSGLTGRIMYLFLDKKSNLAGYRFIPGETDIPVNITLDPFDQFGNALAPYHDIDKNSIKELIVGSPGDQKQNFQEGAIYIVFTRRRRDHPKPFDFLTFILLITIFPGSFCCFCICSVIYFFWYFRRKPDEVEIIVKKAGYQVNPKKERQTYEKKSRVYIEEYTH